jgi:hypothetical protein
LKLSWWRIIHTIRLKIWICHTWYSIFGKILKYCLKPWYNSYIVRRCTKDNLVNKKGEKRENVIESKQNNLVTTWQLGVGFFFFIILRYESLMGSSHYVTDWLDHHWKYCTVICRDWIMKSNFSSSAIMNKGSSWHGCLKKWYKNLKEYSKIFKTKNDRTEVTVRFHFSKQFWKSSKSLCCYREDGSIRQ